MENINIGFLVFVIVGISLLVAAMALAVGYFLASSKTKSTLLNQQETIFKNAQEQLQSWKDQELASIKQQISETAKGLAIQELQEQVRKWKENELQQAKQNIYDVAKGQAMQEMQLQMRKWQEDELPQIRQNMYDAAKGQITQEMQAQMEKWKEMELQQNRQQIHDAVKGQLKQEMAENIQRWQQNELQYIKKQLNEDSEKEKIRIKEMSIKEATMMFEQWKIETEKEIRQDAINKSQSVTIGKMTEHIVPYLPGFNYNPADARFIGSPIDLVVFDGLGDGDVRKIVFVEIKTGKSSLSTRERDVRQVVQEGKFEWLEIKVNLENADVIDEIISRKKS